MKGHNSLAFGVLNRWTEGTPIRVKVTLKSLGLSNVGGYSAKDVFSGDALGVFSPAETITLDVNPTGSKRFLSKKMKNVNSILRIRE